MKKKKMVFVLYNFLNLYDLNLGKVFKLKINNKTKTQTLKF